MFARFNDSSSLLDLMLESLRSPEASSFKASNCSQAMFKEFDVTEDGELLSLVMVSDSGESPVTIGLSIVANTSA